MVVEKPVQPIAKPVDPPQPVAVPESTNDKTKEIETTADVVIDEDERPRVLELPGLEMLGLVPKGCKHSNKMSCTVPESIVVEVEPIKPLEFVNPMISETGVEIDMKKMEDFPMKLDVFTSEAHVKKIADENALDDEELELSDG